MIGEEKRRKEEEEEDYRVKSREKERWIPKRGCCGLAGSLTWVDKPHDATTSAMGILLQLETWGTCIRLPRSPVQVK